MLVKTVKAGLFPFALTSNLLLLKTKKKKNFFFLHNLTQRPLKLCKPVFVTKNNSLIVGATKLGEGFVKGAEATERAIHKGGAKIRDRILPEETPSDVSPHVTRGLNVAKQATGGAVRVSQFLGNVIIITMILKCKLLSEHVAIRCMQLLSAV